MDARSPYSNNSNDGKIVSGDWRADDNVFLWYGVRAVILLLLLPLLGLALLQQIPKVKDKRLAGEQARDHRTFFCKHLVLGHRFSPANTKSERQKIPQAPYLKLSRSWPTPSEPTTPRPLSPCTPPCQASRPPLLPPSSFIFSLSRSISLLQKQETKNKH